MTHAQFPAPAVHAAAATAYARIQAAADADGIRSVNTTAMYQVESLARFAAAAGTGLVSLSLDDFGLLAADLPGAASADAAG